jgi:hypothetical protein
MLLLLRIAALLSLAWAIALPWAARRYLVALGDGVAIGLADGLAVANVAFAYLFWRAASLGGRERNAIYTALLLLALRAVDATYQVLYVLEGPAALVSLADMVTSLALFVGILNTLPGHLKAGGGVGA